MRKKFFVLFLITAFIISSIAPVNASGNDNATVFRNGFNLTPVNSDSAGIAPDTDFLLNSQAEVSLEDIIKGLSIDGEPLPKVEKLEQSKFKVSLSRPLLENKIYTFKLKLDNETTWTFQTRSHFKIVGSIPTDQSVKVPLNSGIEINFNNENYEDIDTFFDITPKAEGRFERHKKTVVFVPKGFSEGTVYTVIVKKGLKVKGTRQGLDEDYTFSFETIKNDPSAEGNKFKGSFFYNKALYDWVSGDAPKIPFNYYIYDEKVDVSAYPIKTSIYTYKDFDSFYQALVKRRSIPEWAYVSLQDNVISTDGLQKVLEFEQAVNKQQKIEDRYLKVPNTLPVGYYVMDSSWNQVRFQTFLQVTDTGVYLTRSYTKTLVWLNDLSSKSPLEGATLNFSDEAGTYTTDQKGITYFDTPVSTTESRNYRQRQYLTVTTKDGKKSVLDFSSYFIEGQQQYWKYISTDRDMYKPDDTVRIWGYIKNRYKEENIKTLNLEISNGYSFYSGLPIIRLNVDVSNGCFETGIRLPMLAPGGYSLSIKNGDTIIENRYIRVENYVKPSYKLEVSKDKEAIFPGQEVNFHVKASFFEGTGVSKLHLDYFVYNYDTGGENWNTKGITDTKGNASTTYMPKVSDSVQGEHGLNFNVRSLLPEIGEINESSNVRLFVNDINVELTGEVKNNTAKISAKVNKIVLDRLNNGTAKDSGDYLGDPVSGKTLSGTIYKNTWVKKEDGEYYDFINKVTQKQYRYELNKEVVKEFQMTTSGDGSGVFSFEAPSFADSYYTAEVKCLDNSGRKMNFTVYMGEQIYYSYYKSGEFENYNLDGIKDSYAVGEKVELTFKKGKRALEDGKFLFIKAQNGIKQYVLSDKPFYSINFNDNDSPNVNIKAVYFNGITYIESDTVDARYKIGEKKLTLEAKTDKDSYRPGETATVKINVKDKNGVPVKSFVNASVVDEAFFKLSDRKEDTLESLYAAVGSGIYISIKSHEYNNREIFYSGRDGAVSSNSTAFYDTMDTKAPMALSKSEAGSGSVRSDFRDTAYFNTVETDNNGYAELQFKLPDNVTSWRITLSGVSQDLQAGSNPVNLNVSLPFFINYSLNSTYLAGDKPVIGVNAYGNALKEDDLVMFEISSLQNPDLHVSAVGKAFDRVNIPLWGFEEGMYDLVIKAYTNSGLSDAIKHTVNVVKSYYEIDKAMYYDLTPQTSFTGGKAGNTRIVFEDKGRGRFLWNLIDLRYSEGNRIDQKLTAYLASELIKKYFNDYPGFTEISDVSLGDYQKEDGGLSLLPYTGSDIELSAKLAPLVGDKVNTFQLKEYFYKTLDSGEVANTALALYGLSSMKEPVLLKVDEFSKVDNLTVKDLIYIALSYCELGEISRAEQIYNDRIAGYIEEYKPYYRVNTGKDQDDILEVTSLGSILASRLSKTEKMGLYQYCMRNSAKDILLSAEEVQFISQEIEKLTPAKSKVVYSYDGTEKTVSLENGRLFSANIPSQKLADFKIVSVEGDVSAVTIFKENVLSIDKTKDNITIERSYSMADGTPLNQNTLKQGDIVKIQIKLHMGEKAFDGAYEVTDYLPSGLKPIENFYERTYYYRNVDGQKIKFYAYKGMMLKEAPTFAYYARVISPGNYLAQGTVVQGKQSKDYVFAGKDEIIHIDTSEDLYTPLDPNRIRVEVNAVPIIFDVQPVVEKGRTLVPVSTIFKALGASVQWSSKTKTVTAQKGDKKVVLTLDSKTALVNGVKTSLDVPATTKGNRTFVPASFVSMSLGADVGWDKARNTVLITSK